MTDQEIRGRFHRAVDTTLSGLEGDPLLAQRIILRAQPREEPKMKKKLSVGLAIVLALLLVSVTAMAAGLWGVLDFIKGYGKTVLDGAADTVQTDIPQRGGRTSWANFTLREAVCDGWVAYLVFDVTPTDEHTLLIFEDMSPEESARYLSDAYPENMTIAQLAEEKGYTNIVRVEVREAVEEKNLQCLSMDAQLTEKGLALIVTGPYRCARTADVALTCIAVPLVGDKETAPLTASLSVDAPLWTAASNGPVDYPEAGVRIESVTLTGTVMCAYAEVVFTVTDQTIYDSYAGGFWLELLDGAGKELPSGAFGMGSMDIFGEASRTGMLTRDVEAMEQPPESIGICAYSSWTKERCAPVIIKLGE